MPERLQSHGRSRRTAHRFQPEGSDSGLEPRLLLTTGLRLGLSQSLVHVDSRTVRAAHHGQRVTPTAEINDQYATFATDFDRVKNAYVESLTSPSTNTATVTATSSAAAIFPSFITTRSQQMAINLVVYFNNAPIKLPAFNAPPHTPIQRGALQSFVYQQVAGGSPTSLVGSLLAIPLPTTTSPDVITIYDLAWKAAVDQSQQRVLSGVNQIFAGKLKVAAPQPANRLGTLFNTSTTTSTNGSAQAGSTTPGTGS